MLNMTYFINGYIYSNLSYSFLDVVYSRLNNGYSHLHID